VTVFWPTQSGNLLTNNSSLPAANLTGTIALAHLPTNLGTPSALTLTNATGLPAAGVVGTAATLGAANVFTRGQTVNGTTDAAQLVIRGHSTQTNKLLSVRNKAGTEVAGIDNGGLITSSNINATGSITASANIVAAGGIASTGASVDVQNNSGAFRLGTGGDVVLMRGGANILDLRNATNAQTFLVNGTYTDASNYLRAALSATSSVVRLVAESAGTGAANINVEITPKGTGAVVAPRYSITTSSNSVDYRAIHADTGMGSSGGALAWYYQGVVGATMSNTAFRVLGATRPILEFQNGAWATGRITGPAGQNGTLELREGTTPSAWRVSNTWTSDTNWEAAVIDFKTATNVARIGTDKGSGGGSNRAVRFIMGGTTKIELDTSGNIILSGVPTSSAGLPSGAIWSDGGTLKIIP
jgi:hypothetical protein